MKMKTIMMALLLAASNIGSARDVMFNWDAVPDPNGGLLKYVIHYGSESGIYTESIEVFNITPDETGLITFVADIVEGPVYFMAVTAVNQSGLESGYSNEAVLEWAAPNAPTNLRIKIPSSTETQTAE